MKRTSSWLSLALLLSLVLMLSSFVVAGASSPADGPWVYSTDLPAVAVRFDTEYYNGKMYLLGYRTDGAGTTDGSVWVYDVGLNTWSDTGVDMPVPVSNYTIAKLADANGVGLYIFGGRDSAGACTNTVQVYYPGTNTTATIATDPWTGEVNPGERVFPGGVEVVNNKAYAWGGFCGTTTAPFTGSQTWIFDPAAAAGSRWTTGPNLPSPGAYQSSAVLDGKVYSIGGDTYDGSALAPYDTVLMLDPANLGAGWQTKAPIPTPSSGVPGCDESRAFGFDTSSTWSLAGKIVLAGCGQWPQDPTTLPDSFVYDGASNTWASFAPLNQARRNHAGAFIEENATCGKIWVGGGYVPTGTNVGTATTEVYPLGCPLAVSLTGFSADGAATARMPWLVLVGAAMLLAAGALARRKLA